MTKYGPIKTDYILFIAAGAFHVSKVEDLIPGYVFHLYLDNGFVVLAGVDIVNEVLLENLFGGFAALVLHHRSERGEESGCNRTSQPLPPQSAFARIAGRNYP